MNYKNKTYNRGGLWSPGSWSTETSTDGLSLHVIVYGRENDHRYWVAPDQVEAEIEKFNRNAFASDDDLIWYILNRLAK